MSKRVQPFTKFVSDQITEVMIKQDEKGIRKYGKPLDPMDNYDWLVMAKEEAADMLKYFEAEHYKRNNTLNKVQHILREIKREALQNRNKEMHDKLEHVSELLDTLRPK